VLASVLGALSGAGINVEHMENRIFAGGTAASAVLRVTGDVSAGVRDQIAAAPAVLAVIVTEDREEEG
jgi:D-3-phosphoglycerate dehydrogenase